MLLVSAASCARRLWAGLRDGQPEAFVLAGMLGSGLIVLVFAILILTTGVGGNGSPIRNFGAADISETEGAWATSVGSGRATLQVEGGLYQIIYATEGVTTRRFSRGEIAEDGDYLIFTPRNDFGRPRSDGYRYYGMGSAPFPVQAKRKGGKLVWAAGPPEYMLPEKIRGRALSYGRERMVEMYGLKNPLFDIAGADYIIWEPLE
ncbi:MAG: hypothetical protein EOM26_02680 [Alphaproteobacteria bacterium]|nr:hypothetical protein [Alphaproteobacteria bacterium]